MTNILVQPCNDKNHSNTQPKSEPPDILFYMQNCNLNLGNRLAPDVNVRLDHQQIRSDCYLDEHIIIFNQV